MFKKKKIEIHDTERCFEVPGPRYGWRWTSRSWISSSRLATCAGTWKQRLENFMVRMSSPAKLMLSTELEVWVYCRLSYAFQFLFVHGQRIYFGLSLNVSFRTFQNKSANIGIVVGLCHILGNNRNDVRTQLVHSNMCYLVMFHEPHKWLQKIRVDEFEWAFNCLCLQLWTEVCKFEFSPLWLTSSRDHILHELVCSTFRLHENTHSDLSKSVAFGNRFICKTFFPPLPVIKA